MDTPRRATAPRTCHAALVWRQEGRMVARARSSFTIFSAALEAKLMARQYSQAPLDESEQAPLPLPDSAHSTPVARE